MSGSCDCQKHAPVQQYRVALRARQKTISFVESYPSALWKLNGTRCLLNID